MLRVSVLGFLFGLSAYSHAQIGGNGVFSILRTPMHSRALAWGGYMSSQHSPDPMQASSNPALLRSGHHLNSAFSAGSLLPTIRTANALFAWHTGQKIADDSLRNTKPTVALLAQYID
ncbi:MAG: hypothetical protein ACK448_00190, partial [Bacteroidota bacterium]